MTFMLKHSPIEVKKITMTKKSVEFHIKSGDYVDTLTTVLSLIRQTLERNKEHKKSLDNIVKI